MDMNAIGSHIRHSARQKISFEGCRRGRIGPLGVTHQGRKVVLLEKSWGYGGRRAHALACGIVVSTCREGVGGKMKGDTDVTETREKGGRRRKVGQIKEVEEEYIWKIDCLQRGEIQGRQEH